jgi:hypothetical protein
MKETDIILNHVYFIIGGCPEDNYELFNGIHIYRTTYRCFEFTPFQFIVNNLSILPYDYVFCTHDTVVFGPDFYKKALHILKRMIHFNYNTFGIGHDKTYSYNIGFYHKDVICNASSILSEINTYRSDKQSLYVLKNKLISYEDKILNCGNRMSIYSEPDITILEKTTLDNETLIVRIKRFDFIDLIKVQMNYNGIYSISTFKDFPRWSQ